MKKTDFHLHTCNKSTASEQGDNLVLHGMSCFVNNMPLLAKVISESSLVSVTQKSDLLLYLNMIISYHFRCEFARTKRDFGISDKCVLTKLNS